MPKAVNFIPEDKSKWNKFENKKRKGKEELHRQFMKTSSDSDTDDEATKLKKGGNKGGTLSNTPHDSSENTRLVVREQIVDA